MEGQTQFLGFDHVDARVSRLAAVEAFYDRLMPKLGLSVKRYANVDDLGQWSEGNESSHNAVEYYEPATAGTPRFFGVIEDLAGSATKTRIAFRVTRAELDS